MIKHNKGRKTKKLWTENEEGDLIEFHQYGTEYEEARKIIHEIEDLSKEGYDYKNMAILYRTNAQSRVFEEKYSIPYCGRHKLLSEKRSERYFELLKSC